MSNPTAILLVDDEEEFVTTLAERLGIRGFAAEAATSGRQALNKMDGRDFDLVVLDVKMPGMGGLEVMDSIKDRSPDLPVILLTGHGAAGEGRQGMHKGASDYLMKPLDIDELISKIHEALTNKSQ
ncbi:MAG: response regulator [Desulfobacteraceae bacterium]|nr:response regulator [Desulfobacteraceae bacterium]MCF8094080.1 response regulator [Desulfobacteraceae bacterium]